MSDTLTITMTDRRPIKIKKDDWPILAEGNDSWHDNQYEFQANRKESIAVRVRHHADGRSIVYGAYVYSTQFQGESGNDARCGYLVEKDGDVIDAIKAAGDNIASRVNVSNIDILYAVNACIADLPAEEI